MPPKRKAEAPPVLDLDDDVLGGADAAGAPSKESTKKKRKVCKEPCSVEDCEEPKVHGKPACKVHVRTFDNMRYQAWAAHQAGDTEIWDAFQRVLKDPAELAK